MIRSGIVLAALALVMNVAPGTAAADEESLVPAEEIVKQLGPVRRPRAHLPMRSASGPRPDPATHQCDPGAVAARAQRTGKVDGVPLVEIPYAGEQFSLLIAQLPGGHTLNALETDLSGWNLAEALATLAPARVSLRLPKFRIDPKSVELKGVLQRAGMTAAFSQAADFSGLTGTPAQAVDQVVHAAGIDVDEQGTVATAATGVKLRAKSIEAPLPELAIDRPFVFAIVHRASGVPIFVGKLADPRAH